MSFVYEKILKEITYPCITRMHPALQTFANSEDAATKLGKNLAVSRIKASHSLQWAHDLIWRMSLAHDMQLTLP